MRRDAVLRLLHLHYPRSSCARLLCAVLRLRRELLLRSLPEGAV